MRQKIQSSGSKWVIPNHPPRDYCKRISICRKVARNKTISVEDIALPSFKTKSKLKSWSHIRIWSRLKTNARLMAGCAFCPHLIALACCHLHLMKLVGVWLINFSSAALAAEFILHLAIECFDIRVLLLVDRNRKNLFWDQHFSFNNFDKTT